MDSLQGLKTAIIGLFVRKNVTKHGRQKEDIKMTKTIFRCRECGAEYEEAGDLQMHCTWSEGHGEEVEVPDDYKAGA